MQEKPKSTTDLEELKKKIEDLQLEITAARESEPNNNNKITHLQRRLISLQRKADEAGRTRDA